MGQGLGSLQVLAKGSEAGAVVEEGEGRVRMDTQKLLADAGCFLKVDSALFHIVLVFAGAAEVVQAGGHSKAATSIVLFVQCQGLEKELVRIGKEALLVVVFGHADKGVRLAARSRGKLAHNGKLPFGIGDGLCVLVAGAKEHIEIVQKIGNVHVLATKDLLKQGQFLKSCLCCFLKAIQACQGLDLLVQEQDAVVFFQGGIFQKVGTALQETFKVSLLKELVQLIEGCANIHNRLLLDIDHGFGKGRHRAACKKR